jgi:hypothetical protein
MSRRTRVRWWLAGLLLLPGCFGLFAQPKPPPKVEGKDALTTRPAEAKAVARSGWELHYPDLTPPDPKLEAESAGAPTKASTAPSGWQLQWPNLAPKAQVSLGEGRAAGWSVRWPNLRAKSELPAQADLATRPDLRAQAEKKQDSKAKPEVPEKK